MASIKISLQRVLERQYELTVNDLSYGKFMHYPTARHLGECFEGLLMDLRSEGIIDKDTAIEVDMHVPEELKFVPYRDHDKGRKT